MEKSLAIEMEEEAKKGVERRMTSADFPLRLSSRIGVWGLLGGIVCSLSTTWGFPFSSALSGVLSATGFLAGGLGIGVASALVLRRTRGPFRLMRLGALLGVPLGVLAALRGVVVLWFPGWALGHLGLLALVTTGAFVFGVALIVLFLVGLLKSAGASDPEEADFS
jgi:hypothetical protein